MIKHTFLFEIGTEELPTKSLKDIAELLFKKIKEETEKNKISYESIVWFATPRRLAVKILGITYNNKTNNTKKNSFFLKTKFSNNFNKKKLIKKCNKSVIKVNQNISSKVEQEKEFLYKNKESIKIIKKRFYDITLKSIYCLSSFKKMRWGYSKENKFIRPVHTITLLLDELLIPGKIFGIKINRVIYGNRFIGKGKIYIKHANQYPNILIKEGYVIADYLKRKEKIYHNIKCIAEKIGGIASINEDLLEEVTASVEWPVVLLASFEKKFLKIPLEILTCILKKEKKYFLISNFHGKLLPYFIFVINFESKEPKKIIFGNERSISSILQDIEFFLEIDKKTKLIDHLNKLKYITFQNQLGSLLDQSKRIKSLSFWIALEIKADAEKAKRAGLLSKCDLSTNLVNEFPYTKGIAGMMYSKYDGEPKEVVLAQKEQYEPKFANDILPTTLVSCSVAIANKVDILVGMFNDIKSKNYISGSSDLFGLRRCAIGIIRIIIEKELKLDLQNLIEKSIISYEDKINKKLESIHIIEFILNRFKSWYNKEKKYHINIIKSILSIKPIFLLDFNARIEAIQSFSKLEEFNNLIYLYKRLISIVDKNTENIKDMFDTSLFEKKEENQLSIYMQFLEKEINNFPIFESKKYLNILFKLNKLAKLINLLFDKVKIMSDNHLLKINRLSLLKKAKELLNKMADFSFLN